MHTLQNLKARYVFPVLEPPIPDGVVSISGGRIVAVGKEAIPGPVEDLGQVALLPGLVNAHTHLEFSLLDRPIGQPGGSFSQWVRLVVELFRRLPASQLNPRPLLDEDQPSKGTSAEALGGRSQPIASEDQTCQVGGVSAGGPLSRAERTLRTGLAELIRTGTTAVADVAQPGFPTPLWRQIGMKAIVFLELRGPTRSRASQAIHQAQEHLAAWFLPLSPPAGEAKGSENIFSPTSGQEKQPEKNWGGQVAGSKSFEEHHSENLWQLGLSPHAPYTVRPELLEAAVALAKKSRLPMAMHLAESPEEIQLLQSGQGPLRTLLEELGQWEPGLVLAPCRPMDYLRQLAQVERALVIHGNYLDEEEWAFLAAHREQMAVVFCPRSHAHFDHRPYPLREMLSWGVRVILGTDSRASAPDMDMLAELRHVAARFPQLAPQKILELATLEAAQALGWGEELGTLAPGRRADLLAVALPDQIDPEAPYELLLHHDLPVTAVWIAGQKVFPARNAPYSEP